MHAERRILICGSGVAGPACAYWLRRHGFRVVLVERAPSLRDAGQNVDIKGAGQQVIRWMGLEERIRAHDTLECGHKWLDADGRLVAAFPKDGFGSLTSDLEIIRGDFVKILFDATKTGCDYRFGTFVTDIVQTAECVSVTFNDGTMEDFELVICAEGMGSSTRRMLMAPQTRLRYLGAYMSFFNIPRRPEDDRWACSVNGIGGTMITLRPGGERNTTVLVTFPRAQADALESADARRALLADALAGRGTLADRILGDLDSVKDFYFGPMSQVQASSWSTQRFVLLGDAAYCPTPFTGKGTALSLVGAYVLAGELKRQPGHAEAFRAYEASVRPYVERAQRQLSERFVRLMHVETPFGIGVARLVQRLLASAAVQGLLKPDDRRRAREVEADFALPDYA